MENSYSWSANPLKLQRAVAMCGPDEAAIKKYYISIGGKVLGEELVVAPKVETVVSETPEEVKRNEETVVSLEKELEEIKPEPKKRNVRKASK